MTAHIVTQAERTCMNSAGREPRIESRRTSGLAGTAAQESEVLLQQPRSGLACLVSDSGSQMGAAVHPRTRSGAATVAISNVMTCTYTTC